MSETIVVIFCGPFLVGLLYVIIRLELEKVKRHKEWNRQVEERLKKYQT